MPADLDVTALAQTIRDGLAYGGDYMPNSYTHGTALKAVDALLAELGRLEREREKWVSQRWSFENRAEVAERGHKAALARDFEQRDNIKELRSRLADAEHHVAICAQDTTAVDRAQEIEFLKAEHERERDAALTANQQLRDALKQLRDAAGALAVPKEKHYADAMLAAWENANAALAASGEEPK